MEGVNLSSYIGQTLTVVITNADCRLGGHFAHSYWDFACGSSSAILKPNCFTNSPDTLVAPAPPDSINTYTYEWFHNNNPIPIATSQIITPYAQPGDTFVVKVILPSGCNWYARYVPQHYSVTADYIYSTHCGYVDFTAQSISPSAQDPINFWSWNFNGGSPSSSSLSNPDSVTFSPGTHSVTLISGTYSTGCRDTIQYMINVPQNPVAAFNASNVCAGYPLPISNNSIISVGDTVSSYSWNIVNGNPATSSAFNPVVTISSPGSSQITLIVNTTGGCSDTIQHTVNINETPVAAFSAQPFCLDEQLSLLNTSTLSPAGGTLSYSWSFTGGTPAVSSAVTPAVSYLNPGNSTIKLIATSTGGCTDTVEKNISIYPLPHADFSAPLNCFGSPYVLTNLSSAIAGDTLATYAWTIGNATPAASSQVNPVVSFQTVDTSLVELITTTIHGCADTITKQVIVSAKPHADFSLTNICAGSAVTFSNNSSIQPAGANITYTWSIPGGSITSSTLENPVVSFSNDGSYSISLIVLSDGGCKDTIENTLTVFPVPQSSFVSPSICKGSTVTLVNQSSVHSGIIQNYFWSAPHGQPAVSQAVNPSIRFDTTGIFPVSLITETPNGCRDTSSGTVSVYKVPVIQIDGPDSGCVPICHTFIDHSISADGSITQWQWNFPGGNPSISNSQNPGEICYDTPGNFDANLSIVSDHGCLANKSFKNIIKAYSNPVADFRISPEIFGNYPPIRTFNDQSTANVVQWLWNFGDSSGVVNGGPVENHSYSSVSGNDFYKFFTSLIVSTDHGCRDTIFKPIEINPYFSFFVPNAFTPNDDNENNFFYAKGMGIKNYDFRVFDRWGLEIWSCQEEGSNVPWDYYGEEGMSSSCKWDGTIRGSRVQQDVYVWKANVTDIFGKHHVYIGSVTVFY
jgi:PKD repeat protein